MFGWLKSMASANPAIKRHLMSIPLTRCLSLLNRIGRSMSDEVLLIVGFEENRMHPSKRPSRCSRWAETWERAGEQWFTHRHDVSYKLAPVFMAGAF